MKRLIQCLHLLALALTPALPAAPTIANGVTNEPVSAPSGPVRRLDARRAGPQDIAASDWASIRAVYEAGRHAFQPIAGHDGVWQARNPGQQWTTTFDRRGFVAEPRGGGWQWGLELKGYGFPGAVRDIRGVPAVKAEGQRLSYDWDAAVQEWFVNDQRGLEHGFTVKARPAGAADAPLQFDLAIRGTLTPHLTADALGVEFRDAAGATMLTYGGLKVWDADGKVLPSRFAPSDSELPTPNSQPAVRLLVEERGARYPLTIDPIAQQAYLKASQVSATDRFGVSVAISGDTVVVGANGEDGSATGVNGTEDEAATDAGAAYVFVRSGTTWSQQAYLKPAAVGTTQAGDAFGASVAVAGDTVVVGAPVEDGSATGVNGPADEAASGAGAAYIFVRSGTTWSQQAYLKASQVSAGDIFGISVAVSGDTVVVGATDEDGSATGVNGPVNETALQAGAAYVFVRNGTTWSQQAYLKPATVGTTQAGDIFGNSVAVSGDTVVIGAPSEDGSATGVNGPVNETALQAGAAYVFVRSGTTWSQQAYLKASQVSVSDSFGNSVAVAGDTVVVGAILEDSSAMGVNGPEDELANGSGAAYVFVRSGTTWSQQAYLKPAAVGTTQAGDGFGRSVAVAGDTVVVGAFNEDGGATGVNGQADELAPTAGAAYVFVRSGTTWSQQAYLKAVQVTTMDAFGLSVAVAGDTVVVGATGEDGSATGVDGPVDELVLTAGAAYIFTGLGPSCELIGPGAIWKYLDDGSDQGTAWSGTGFDDTGWAAGPAELGYGDSDESTLVSFGSDPNNKHFTTYFRRTFVVPNPSAIMTLVLCLRRDDGAVVYLNGAEVFRSNLPGGAVNHQTLATTDVSGADETTWFKTCIDPTLLLPGVNLIAVEVHQASATSDDVSFDLALKCNEPCPNNCPCPGSPTVPLNDTPATATPLTAPATVSGCLKYAGPTPLGVVGTFPPLLPLLSQQAVNDVWYSFSPTVGGIVTVDTCGASDCPSDTVLAVYQGSPEALLINPPRIGGNYKWYNNNMSPVCALNPLASQVMFNARACATYYIRVSARNVSPTPEGFTLNLTQQPDLPPNHDACGSPKGISANKSVSFSNRNASTAAAPPPAIFNDLWYCFTAPPGAVDATVETCTTFNSALAVYTGNNCNSLTLVSLTPATANCPAGAVGERWTFLVQPTVKYLIRVGGVTSADVGCGFLRVSSGVPPPNTLPVGSPTWWKTYKILGLPNSQPWDWSLTAAGSCNFNIQGTAGGATGTALALATAFANSINAVGAGQVLAQVCLTAACTARNEVAYLKICTPCMPKQVVLKVGPVGNPDCWVENQTLLGAFPPCVFNPSIHEISDPDEDPDAPVPDCNGNGESDYVDIALGNSLDEDGNGVPDECPIRLNVAFQTLNNKVVISWPALGAILEQSTNAAGPWHEVSGATSPYPVAPPTGQTFFRLRLP